MTSEPYSLIVITAAHLGQLLVSSRKRRKLTQAQVALQLGLSQNRLSYLEHHPEMLSFKQLLSYSAVVGLHIQLSERPVIDDSENLPEW
jgi:HTH-type transcriptional regulator/antitoxin HipB